MLRYRKDQEKAGASVPLSGAVPKSYLRVLMGSRNKKEFPYKKVSI